MNKAECSGKGSFMSQKIYVGNLNYGTTEDALTSAFSQYGEVLSSVIIKDRYTEQSKGFGFVEMADADAANAAIATLNGKEIDGRRVRINVAEDKPRSPRPRGKTSAAVTADNNTGQDARRPCSLITVCVIYYWHDHAAAIIFQIHVTFL